MPYKIKGIKRIFYLPTTAREYAKKRKIKTSKIYAVRFGDM